MLPGDENEWKKTLKQESDHLRSSTVQAQRALGEGAILYQQKHSDRPPITSRRRASRLKDTEKKKNHCGSQPLLSHECQQSFFYVAEFVHQKNSSYISHKMVWDQLVAEMSKGHGDGEAGFWVDHEVDDEDDDENEDEDDQQLRGLGGPWHVGPCQCKWLWKLEKHRKYPVLSWLIDLRITCEKWLRFCLVKAEEKLLQRNRRIDFLQNEGN